MSKSKVDKLAIWMKRRMEKADEPAILYELPGPTLNKEKGAPGRSPNRKADRPPQPKPVKEEEPVENDEPPPIKVK